MMMMMGRRGMAGVEEKAGREWKGKEAERKEVVPLIFHNVVALLV